MPKLNQTWTISSYNETDLFRFIYTVISNSSERHWQTMLSCWYSNESDAIVKGPDSSTDHVSPHSDSLSACITSCWRNLAVILDSNFNFDCHVCFCTFATFKIFDLFHLQNMGTVIRAFISISVRLLQLAMFLYELVQPVRASAAPECSSETSTGQD